MALKWGIAAAGLICHDFVNAIGTLSEDDHQVIAVAARDLDRASEFAQRFDIAKAYGSYCELAQDCDIEIVYIGVLIPQHLEVAMLMLDHGKHVLCEKPLCLNEKQVRILTSYAKQKGLFLMEGTAKCDSFIIHSFGHQFFRLFMQMINHLKGCGHECFLHTNIFVSKLIAVNSVKSSQFMPRLVMPICMMLTV